MSEEKANRACAIGVINVLSVWKNMNDGYPYFAVFYTRGSKFFQYTKDDIDAAEEFLRINLSALEDQGDNAMYYLNIYDEPKKNYTNSGMVCAFPFRLNEFKSSVGSIGSGVGVGGSDSMLKLLQDAHVKELELVKQIAELNAQNQPLDWFDKISGVLEHPGAAQMIGQVLSPVIGQVMGVLGKITGVPGQTASVTHQPQIAGPVNADADQLLDMQLDRLQKHGDLLDMLTTLANFADKNPEMFKNYFSMLKSQG